MSGHDSTAGVAHDEQFTDPRINPRVAFQQYRTVLRANERVAWRLPILVLVISKFRGQRASVSSLHLLLWALKSTRTRTLLLSWWQGQQPADLATVRSDPHLEVTLGIAVAEDIVEVTSTGRVELTERGREFAALLDEDSELMTDEKNLLGQLRPLNDATIIRHMGGAAIDY